MRWSLWPPAFSLYVPLRWIWRGALGRSFLPGIVFLDYSVLDHPDADAIWRHELQHQRQGWRYLWVGFWLRYALSPRWRQLFEWEAEAAE